MYLGTDEVLDRTVAVKVLRTEFMESDIGARFRREGRTAARLSHPNIVQVYDAGEDELDGEVVSYIVMEHVPGGDLRDQIEARGTLSTEEVSNLRGVASGLAHAHERDIIHRDIKPPNILLGKNQQPKLADFGIARALDATQATRTGTYMGTARYSSPEQLQGKEITPKSDIYSLGATLYEAVTGSPMFSGTPIQVASQHVSNTPTPPGELAPVDHGLEALILSCLAKDPDDRPGAQEVRSMLSNPPLATGATAAYAASLVSETTTVQEDVPTIDHDTGRQRLSRRAPLLVALVAILALMGVVGAYALLSTNGQQAKVPAVTSQEPTTQAGAGGDSESAQKPADTTPGSATQETTPNSTQPGKGSGSQADSSSRLGGSEQAAAKTVRNVYQLAAAGKYEQSYELLSQNFKQTHAPTVDQWRGTFTTLDRISFVQGPSAQVTGGSARVEGVTRAVHTDETQRNTAEWTLILEDGQWKLNSVNIISKKLV
ncbi:hypothetical protein BH23ACT11_BH23ACT11_28370 [soil metagenome]